MVTKQEQRVIDAAREVVGLGASFREGALRGVILGALDPLHELHQAVIDLDAIARPQVTCSRCPECGQLIGEDKSC